MQRNDLGMRHIVKELARNGFVAVAPDFNAAFTGGWGEPDPTLRLGQVADAVLARIAVANRGGVNRFGVPLRGKVDFTRFGLLGHSRSGFHSQHWAWSQRTQTAGDEIEAGRGRVSALLQLAPAGHVERPIVDVPMTVVVSQCDGDVGPAGRFIARRRATRAAQRRHSRSSLAARITTSSTRRSGFPAATTACSSRAGPHGRASEPCCAGNG